MNEVIEKKDFIRDIIDEDIKNGKHKKIKTRFPPEPNGYLHIGHAKSICLNFGISQEYQNATCNLRFDDTNPEKEEMEYIDSIKEDVKWLGFDWGENLFHASCYFDKLHKFAVYLIEQGKAYVDNLSFEEIREYRGTLTKAGKNSPYRDRSIEENLNLFEEMRNGNVEEGKCVLRAKIDMKSPNLNMRDPVIYRVKKSDHPKTGDKWCIYPMYDFTHGYSDAIEGITHSLCTLEFEDHRPLYDWFLDQLPAEWFPSRPRQIEFSRLELTYTIMSKRMLIQLVKENHVSGWNDPRMVTISGFRRRGYTPKSIREFMKGVGISKSKGYVEFSNLEYYIRQELNATSPRVMAVIDPLKVVITNYPEDKVEEFDVEINPEDKSSGTRKVPFCREIYIEKSDFMEEPSKKFFRLRPDGEVRLKNAYFIKCEEIIKDNKGNIIELRCSYDPLSKGGNSPDGRKVKGTLHWVSVKHGKKIEVREYDRLFKTEFPGKETGNFLDDINSESLTIKKHCIIEPAFFDYNKNTRYQFMRNGYYYPDPFDSTKEKPVFNQIVKLKDTWQNVKK
ncbi:MAG: glutamine--tRNA ligase/YqeY domain fusion protein [Candidatus Muirbacterium halophilum]|nr:glutamine--tRNA ligase/YqeY domain fusion protein [Candidatus Muirbacterium halophilum]MCK9474278.1 glutamine--tRNA ligase/YqeY domain fusion protein [Candidatus Muirbacterium halophilum]